MFDSNSNSTPDIPPLSCVDCGMPLWEGEFMRCSMCEQLDEEKLLLDEDDEDI